MSANVIAESAGSRLAHKPFEMPPMKSSAVAEEIRAYAREIARQANSGGHFVILTGAGISTLVPPPDYVDEQGVQSRGYGASRHHRANRIHDYPTVAHMAIVALQTGGIVKHVITTATDGLHRQSGILRQKLSEVNGNIRAEMCSKCGNEFLADGPVVRPAESPSRARVVDSYSNHWTGNYCNIPSCKGRLYDTVVREEEATPQEVQDTVLHNVGKADLILCVGVDVSRPTEADILASAPRARIVACTDAGAVVPPNVEQLEVNPTDILLLMIEYLGLPLPQFVLRRRVTVGFALDRTLPGMKDKFSWRVFVRGPNSSSAELEKVDYRFQDGRTATSTTGDFTAIKTSTGPSNVTATLHFKRTKQSGAPLLPPCSLDLGIDTNTRREVVESNLVLAYDPMLGRWEVSPELSRPVFG